MEGGASSELIKRVARSEKAVSLLTWGLSVLGIVAAALVGFTAVVVLDQRSRFQRSQVNGGRVSAREFVVTDENAKPVAWFGAVENGAVGFILTARQSHPSKTEAPAYIRDLATAGEKFGGALLLADDTGVDLSLIDPSGKDDHRDAVSLSTGGALHESRVAVTGKKGLSAELSSGFESAGLDLSQPIPSAEAWKKTGIRETSISLFADGSSNLTFSSDLFSGKDQPYARLAVDADGTPALSLFDRNWNQRGSFKLTPDGEPAVVLCNKGDFILSDQR
jgi:hypothetical protein